MSGCFGGNLTGAATLSPLGQGSSEIRLISRCSRRPTKRRSCRVLINVSSAPARGPKALHLSIA
jgi:hypothetical protein